MTNKFLQMSEARLESAGDYFDCLSHRSRLDIIYVVAQGELSFEKLRELIPFTTSNLKRHLKRLATYSLITTRLSETNVVYIIPTRRTHLIAENLRHLAALYPLVKEEHRRPSVGIS